jgi:DNA polymerase elongation subunit (family B)
MKKVNKAIITLKKHDPNSKDISLLEDALENLDLDQLTKKLILNSTYGVCGFKFSPFFNVNIAEAITLSGQKIINMSNDFIEDYIKTEYGEPVNKSTIIVYNDTDSIYANVESVVTKITDGDLTKKSNVKKVVKEIDATINAALNQWCIDHLSYKIFHASKTDRIKFIREKFCDVAYFFKKKRYLLHVLDDEGKSVDKFIYKGIALNRSTYPAIAKTFMRETFETSIKERWDESIFTTKMMELYNDFTTKDFNEIAIIKGLKSYVESSTEFQAPKGTSGHARAALYHNQLIEKMGLENKYKLIKEGQIKVCYIKPNNMFGIKAIAFDEEIPIEFREYFTIDYNKMFEILFINPLEDFCTCNGWAHFTAQKAMNEVDVMSL